MSIVTINVLKCLKDAFYAINEYVMLRSDGYLLDRNLKICGNYNGFH